MGNGWDQLFVHAKIFERIKCLSKFGEENLKWAFQLVRFSGKKEEKINAKPRWICIAYISKSYQNVRENILQYSMHSIWNADGWREHAPLIHILNTHT